MNRLKNIKIFIIFQIIFFLNINGSNILTDFLFSKSSNVGFSILKITPDAFSSALSGGVTTGYNSPSSFLINPASSSFYKEKGMVVSTIYSSGFSNIYSGAIKYPFFFGTFSFSATSSISDTIQLRNEDPTENPLGYYRFNSYSFSLGYSNTITDGIFVGLSSSAINENSFLLNKTSFVASAGVLLVFERFFNFKVGVSTLNVGFKTRYDPTSLDYIIPPFTLKIGSSFDIKINENFTNTIFSDFTKVNDQEFKISFGYDGEILKTLSLRIGFLINDPTKFLSFGIGVRNNSLSLNYSFVPFNYGLGFENCVSLNYNF
ncbi:MAG: PorV/PorQ family protein [candidate division WOR-3 bacterium]